MIIYIELLVGVLIFIILLFWGIWFKLSKRRLLKKYTPENDKSKRPGDSFQREVRKEFTGPLPAISPPVRFRESEDVHNFIRELNAKKWVTWTNSNMVLKEYKNSAYVSLD